MRVDSSFLPFNPGGCSLIRYAPFPMLLRRVTLVVLPLSVLMAWFGLRFAPFSFSSVPFGAWVNSLIAIWTVVVASLVVRLIFKGESFSERVLWTAFFVGFPGVILYRLVSVIVRQPSFLYVLLVTVGMTLAVISLFVLGASFAEGSKIPAAKIVAGSARMKP